MIEIISFKDVLPDLTISRPFSNNEFVSEKAISFSAFSFISLLAVTSATLWQKKLSNNLSLPVSNMYQAIGGFLFHILIVLFFTEPYINFSSTFIIAMTHQIVLVSFGAFTILMYLIKHHSASKTVSLFFLIPATSALIAWIFLNETLNIFDIFGFIIASVGVFIATREYK